MLLHWSPKLMTINEQSNHHIVHLLGLRKTDCLSCKSLDASSRLLNASAQSVVCWLSRRCDAARLRISGMLPNYQCRTAEPVTALTVAEVASALNLRTLPIHRQELFRFDGQWRATTTVDVALTRQSSTFHPSPLFLRAPPSRLRYLADAVRAGSCLLVQVDLTFFQRFNDRCRANPQHSCRIADSTAIDCHIADLRFDFT